MINDTNVIKKNRSEDDILYIHNRYIMARMEMQLLAKKTPQLYIINNESLVLKHYVK